MIVLIIRLLNAGAKFLDALTKFIVAALVAAVSMTDGDLSALKRWWQGAPQEQAQSQPLPVLSKEAEALYFQVVQLIENQQQVDELRRYVLTLPALPEEGY
jgi:hypothetical protein